MGEIKIEDVGPIRVIGMRKRGRYQEMAGMFVALVHHAMANNIQLTGPAIFVSHEMSEEEALKAQEEGSADLEATFPYLGDHAPEAEDIKAYELPGGKMAKLLYKGPYDQMSQTYRELFAWIQKNGKTVDGLIRECYLNNPEEVGMENALTEIQVPIR
ncbi:MAG: GyrI-like domain-containing protein [Thermoplasmatota archaeon]